MDERDVERGFEDVVWPALRALGFDRFEPRAAWRRGEGQVDVVEFLTFNARGSRELGIPRHSFTVVLGKYHDCIPPAEPLAGALARVSECPLRGRLRPFAHPADCDPTIWFIDARGDNLARSLQDLRAQLPEADAWFARLADRAEVLRILREEPGREGEFWGFGKPGSPVRSYLTGYVALSLGDEALARQELRKVVDSRVFTPLFTSVDEAIARVATPA